MAVLRCARRRYFPRMIQAQRPRNRQTTKSKCSGAHFQIALWFYSGEESADDRMAEELSRCASEIVLIPGAGADVAKRRPQLVKLFGRLGFLPDYICDLSEIDPGTIRLRRQPSGSANEVVSAVETAFARLNRRLADL